VCKYLPFLFQG